MISAPWNDKGTDRRGAYMGRQTLGAGLPHAPLCLRKVPLDKGGYDPGGAYWGRGEPLYCAFTKDGTWVRWTRALSPLGAKINVYADTCAVLTRQIEFYRRDV